MYLCVMSSYLLILNLRSLILLTAYYDLPLCFFSHFSVSRFSGWLEGRFFLYLLLSGVWREATRPREEEKRRTIV